MELDDYKLDDAYDVRRDTTTPATASLSTTAQVQDDALFGENSTLFDLSKVREI